MSRGERQGYGIERLDTYVLGRRPSGYAARALWASGCTEPVQAYAELRGGSPRALLEACDELAPLLPLALIADVPLALVVDVAARWTRGVLALADLEERERATVESVLDRVRCATPAGCAREAERVVRLLRSGAAPARELALRAALHTATVAAQSARPARACWDAEQVGALVSRALTVYSGTRQLTLEAASAGELERGLLAEGIAIVAPTAEAAE